MNKRSLSVAGVFLVGCAVGGVSSQLVVPKASAQQEEELPAWEYRCMQKSLHWMDSAKDANKMGAARWEAFSTEGNSWCFKRPKI
jgi:hypothetical protein